MAILEGKLLAFIALLLSGQNGNGGATVILPPAKRPKDLPPPSIEPGQPTAPEWPASVPTGLPPFPGPGWEYDQPPSAGVMTRAAAILDDLWSQGAGAHDTEFLEGHYVTFLAEVVAGGKKGVTAWRVKVPGAPSPPVKPPSLVSPVIPDAPIIPSNVVIPVHPAALGMDPRDVQDDLNKLGYGPLVVDGVLGPASKAAIRTFQGDNPPLAVDGIVGQQTASVLIQKMAGLHGSPVVLPPTPATSSVQSVKDVQNALTKLQYGPLTADGIMGPKTGAAIRNFQGDHPPLVVDGVAGPATKTALSNALAGSVFIEHDDGTVNS